MTMVTMAVLSRILLAIFFVSAGINHFVSPTFYLLMMPPYLPWPLELVYISGLAEILGGIGVLSKMTRRGAGWGLIALLIAVFPANIYAAVHGMDDIPAWMLWARLPLQVVLIWWVYSSCISPRRSAA
jgi:uncharacterized membrane protein